jgi:hypothetical protein
MTKNNKKIVHNKHYNKIQILQKDLHFQDEIKKIKKGFVVLGCPLPKDGLKNEKEYDSWIENFFECRSKVSKHPEFFKESFRKILIENNINPENKFYNDFLKSYVFFNKKEPETTPIIYKVTFNKKIGEYELYLRIFPHTNKKDIDNIWNKIEKEKKILFSDENVISKPWTEMERDIRIYDEHIKINKLSLEEKLKRYTDTREEFIIEKELGGKYGDLSYAVIRRAINKVKMYKKVTDNKPSKT